MEATTTSADLFGVPLVNQQSKAPRKSDQKQGKEDEICQWHDLTLLEKEVAERIPEPTEIEHAFRHRHWIQERKRVHTALVHVQIPHARMERFNRCGSDCIVEVSQDGQSHRLRANYCGDRFCDPCQQGRAVGFKERILDLMKGHRCSFTTFTLADDGGSYAERHNRLVESFKLLRDRKWWKSQGISGIGTVQTTLGQHGDHWHVHLHVIHTGPPLDLNALRLHWWDITEDSYIVDSRWVRDSDQDAGYIARYATKGIEPCVTHNFDRLCECISALRGRRMLITFGEWHGAEIEDQPVSPTKWRKLGRLHSITLAAKEGQAWAIGVLRSLRVEIDGQAKSIAFLDIIDPIKDLAPVGRHPPP